jgi:hypothetical protein
LTKSITCCPHNISTLNNIFSVCRRRRKNMITVAGKKMATTIKEL